MEVSSSVLSILPALSLERGVIGSANISRPRPPAKRDDGCHSLETIGLETDLCVKRESGACVVNIYVKWHACLPTMRRRSRNARYRIPLSVHQFVRLLNTTSTEREDLLSELYFNRTVAVVGPAGYLEQQQQLQHSKMEQTIQNADTVVRPNVKFDPNTRSLFLPPHTTSRTTIVYHSGLAPVSNKGARRHAACHGHR